MVLKSCLNETILLSILTYFNPLIHWLFLIMTSFSILDNIEKNQENLSKVLNTFENIMENGAFALQEQMLHFP